MPNGYRFAATLFAFMTSVAFMPQAALAQSDYRIAVALPESDRDRLQEDMRYFLRQQGALLDAAIQNDMTHVAEIAQKAKPPLARIRALAGGMPPPQQNPSLTKSNAKHSDKNEAVALYLRMQKNLPQPFKDMLLEMRETVAEIERDAKGVKQQKHTLEQLSRIHNLCVSCHEVYRATTLPPGRGN